MKKVHKKIINFLLTMSIAGTLLPVSIHGTAAKLPGNRQQLPLSVQHSSLGTLSVQSSLHADRSSTTLTLYSGTTSLGRISYMPASALNNKATVSWYLKDVTHFEIFKQATHGHLDKYAFIHSVYIDPKHRSQKLTTFLFWVLHQELKKHNYTGLCLIAGPFEYNNFFNPIFFENDLAVYNHKLHNLLQIYTHLGLTALSSPNSKTPVTIPCIQHHLNNILLPRTMSLPQTMSLSMATRLLQFWNHYRDPILIGTLIAEVALLVYLRKANRSTHTMPLTTST